jgi:hypothetical protein
MKRPRPRRRRHEHFLASTSGTSVGISHVLLQAAHLLLQAALEERRAGVWRTKQNHATYYAPAVVITVLTALDAWLSELIGFSRSWIGVTDEQVASVIDIGTVPDKYRRTAELVFQERVNPSSDLRLLSTVRHEIVHFLPYAQNISANVPDWLQQLAQKDLLITTGKTQDFHFSQKLGSYGLAYWACETVFAAAQQLAEKTPSGHPLHHLISPDNFRVVAGIHAPEELPDFDAKHGLPPMQ